MHCSFTHSRTYLHCSVQGHCNTTTNKTHRERNLLPHVVQNTDNKQYPTSQHATLQNQKGRLLLTCHSIWLSNESSIMTAPLLACMYRALPWECMQPIQACDQILQHPNYVKSRTQCTEKKNQPLPRPPLPHVCHTAQPL